MTCRLSWLALGDGEGRYRTVGLLGVGGGKVRFRALPEFLANEGFYSLHITNAASKKDISEELFDYELSTGNGITREFSAPFELEAPDLDFALDLCVAKRSSSLSL